VSRWALRCLGLNQLFERAHRDIVLPELIPHKGVVEGHVRLVREVPRGVVEEICRLTHAQRYRSARSARSTACARAPGDAPVSAHSAAGSATLTLALSPALKCTLIWSNHLTGSAGCSRLRRAESGDLSCFARGPPLPRALHSRSPRSSSAKRGDCVAQHMGAPLTSSRHATSRAARFDCTERGAAASAGARRSHNVRAGIRLPPR